MFDIIYEDAGLLVINKPAGLVCHPTKPDGCSSLVLQVRNYVRDLGRLHLVNRLDRETSGVVLVAKKPEVALELRRIWQRRQVRKQYLAIVRGQVCESRGRVEAALGRDEQSRVAVKDRVRPDGAAAQTEFEVLRRFRRAEGDFSLLRIWPLTGRKHQIRLHLAHLGHPIVGGKLYGGNEDCYLALVQRRLTVAQKAWLIFANQALHAEEVRFNWRGQERVFHAQPEACFAQFMASGLEL